jgi:hypothetical protein
MLQLAPIGCWGGGVWKEPAPKRFQPQSRPGASGNAEDIKTFVIPTCAGMTGRGGFWLTSGASEAVQSCVTSVKKPLGVFSPFSIQTPSWQAIFFMPLIL